MGRKLTHIVQIDGRHAWAFWCPACEEHHSVTSEWTYNGIDDAPTFTPDITAEGTVNHLRYVCHFNVTGGKLIYLPDCTHKLAGMIVDMLDLPDPPQPGI